MNAVISFSSFVGRRCASCCSSVGVWLLFIGNTQLIAIYYSNPSLMFLDLGQYE